MQVCNSVNPWECAPYLDVSEDFLKHVMKSAVTRSMIKSCIYYKRLSPESVPYLITTLKKVPEHEKNTYWRFSKPSPKNAQHFKTQTVKKYKIKTETQTMVRKTRYDNFSSINF